jgi:hypothetical protein
MTGLHSPSFSDINKKEESQITGEATTADNCSGDSNVSSIIPLITELGIVTQAKETHDENI